jgi:hypothetical protein
MSLLDIFNWLAGLDFPSISAIWNWLITVPWWLAIFTIALTIFIIRLTWSLTTYCFKWLSEAMFDLGERSSEWVRVARIYRHKTLEFGRSIKRILF